ncbi:MAG: non-homologous end-joining DNA ligase [Acidimicrobiia bacterium]|nr:non-homologous end-joining DNA ligase [Acidimicrobiia bacterium]
MTDTQVEISGKRLKLSNLDKVFYPQTGFTKGQVIDYYTRVAGALLPHLAKRPLTLKRYPNGVDEKYFYEKRCPSHRPAWVATAPVESDRHGGPIDYCVCNDLATLVWVANMASIELHPSLSHEPKIARPTTLAFDLDPGPPAAILECAQVGLWVRAVLDELGLQSFPKTSGSKGLQVYVPLNTPVTYADTKGFAHALARLLEKQHPAEVVSVMTKDLRKGKVFIDWSQNDEHKTTVSVYSLRARETPTASTPVRWDEVQAALEAGDADALRFEAPDVIERVEADGDLFASVDELKQKLPKL